MKTLQLMANNQLLDFHQVELTFYSTDISNIFAAKNNKTLAETIATSKYHQYADAVHRQYSHLLNMNLGEFMFSLKSSGDMFYTYFLNGYGDAVYCHFAISERLNNRGLYCYAVEDQIKYVGRCTDTFRKRINQGYGKIHPKNCYKDGQSTNCHLNHLINQYRDKVEFFVSIREDVDEIKQLEPLLIRQINPEWNRNLKTKAE